jgi:hypothetical protein
MPLYQVDDLDGDGTGADEIVFLTSLQAGQKKTFNIEFFKEFKAWPKQQRFTDATNMPGWESDLFGYRSYGAFVIDMFAKYRSAPGLMLKTFYNESNKQIYNYHVDSPLGMDILHVGPTVGLGSIVLKCEEKIYLPSSGSLQCKVKASGPVRSMVTIQKSFSNDIGDFKISREVVIYAHHFETSVRDVVKTTLLKTDAKVYAGTGMKNSGEASSGMFLSWHNQPMYQIGEMGMGIYLVNPASFFQSEDDKNYYYWMDKPLNAGTVSAYSFTAFGAWQRAGYVNEMSGFKRLAEEIVALDTPLIIQTLGLKQSGN